MEPRDAKKTPRLQRPHSRDPHLWCPPVLHCSSRTLPGDDKPGAPLSPPTRTSWPANLWAVGGGWVAGPWMGRLHGCGARGRLRAATVGGWPSPPEAACRPQGVGLGPGAALPLARQPRSPPPTLTSSPGDVVVVAVRSSPDPRDEAGAVAASW